MEASELVLLVQLPTDHQLEDLHGHSLQLDPALVEEVDGLGGGEATGDV